MRQLAKLAACALNQWALDFDGNSARIVKSIVEAKRQGARIRVGPELEVTGYSCQDHFNESDTLLHSWQVLVDILKHPDTGGILLIIGMPVMYKSVTYNCAVVALDGKIVLIRPKMMMCDDGNYRESRYFAGWRKRRVEEITLPEDVQQAIGQKSTAIGDAVVELNDTTMGVEICEEIWNLNSPHVAMSMDGVELFVHPSASYHELRKSHAIEDHVRHCTLKCGGAYVYSNLRGCDGDRLYFSSNVCIAMNGDILAQGNQFGLEEVVVVTAVVDLEDIRTYRNRWRSSTVERALSDPYPRVKVDFTVCGRNVGQETLPIKWEYHTPEEEIMLGPACYLWDYLRRSGHGGFFLPLSGGKDSASVSCIIFSMCNLIFDAVSKGDDFVLKELRGIVGSQDYVPTGPKEICSKLMHTAYLGTVNSSLETKKAASDLAAEIGSTHLSLVVDSAIQAVLNIFQAAIGKLPRFRVHGGTERENLALQNIQARVRMVISYFFAQSLLWAKDRPSGLLVLSTTNVDENLFGYATKYDCSSGDINPIGSISKKDLAAFLKHMRDTYNMKSLDLAQTSAELEPLEDGKCVQNDEMDMGVTYDELSTLGLLRKPGCHGPYSTFCKLVPMWSHMTPKEIAVKVKRFFVAHAVNRHKTTVLTPSYHATSYSPDDRRHDHRPFLYNISWSLQFRMIDRQVEELERQQTEQVAAA